MDKIASTAQLTAKNLQKIALFGFATALASPVLGFGPAETKQASIGAQRGLEQNAARHERFKKVILDFATA